MKSKKEESMKNINLTSKKKMRNTLFIVFIVLILLISRIGYIQFVKGGELTTLAYKQQSLDRSINPKRGTIYDSTGKYILAISSTVYTVTINPTNIPAEEKEKVSKALSDILSLDYKEKKFNRNCSKKNRQNKNRWIKKMDEWK